jgi:hypothetical protein
MIVITHRSSYVLFAVGCSHNLVVAELYRVGKWVVACSDGSVGMWWPQWSRTSYLHCRLSLHNFVFNLLNVWRLFIGCYTTWVTWSRYARGLMLDQYGVIDCINHPSPWERWMYLHQSWTLNLSNGLVTLNSSVFSSPIKWGFYLFIIMIQIMYIAYCCFLYQYSDVH